MRSFVVLIMAAVLLAGCINPPAPPANNTSIPVISSPNATANATNTSAGAALPDDYSVNFGDQVSVIYALYVDGGLRDTNNETLAKEAGIYNVFKKYQPFTFDVLLNKGVIDGFILNVIGMEMNETVSFTVQPSKGYGEVDPRLKVVVERYYEKSLYETTPRSYFEERNVTIANGSAFNTTYGTVFITDFDEENVTIFFLALAAPNYSFRYNNVPQRVVSQDNLTATIEVMLTENKTYDLPHPATGQPTRFLVTEKTDQNITLDANHPLAGKELNFVVTLVDAVPGHQR